MAFETSPGILLKLIWSAGPMGQGFLALAVAALVLLVVLIGRSRFVLSLNTAMFLNMVEKVVAAGNLDRALKLSQAHQGPVALMVRAGVEKALDVRGSGDPLEPARQAEAEMQRTLPEATARVRRGAVPALLLSVAAFAAGLAAAAGPARAAAAGIGALLLAIVAGSVTLGRDLARYDRDLSSTIKTVTGLLKIEALGAQGKSGND